MKPVLVDLANAEIVQGGQTILKNVNLQIYSGDFVYFVGRTGSGKSSLLQTLYGDLWLHKGSGTVAGFKLEKLLRTERPFLRRKLGIIFQDFQLLTDRNVGENLYFLLEAMGWNDKKQMHSRILDVLKKLDMTHAMDKMPFQLSGGEQQRVSIARALLNKPEVIIADEPTGNLDPEVGKQILKIFYDLNQEGTVVIMATHNYDHIHNYPGRIFRFENKHVAEVSLDAR